jgi:hypothetical protein
MSKYRLKTNKKANGAIRDAAHRIYGGVLYFQTVIWLHGKVVSVPAGTSVPFASRNTHMLSSKMCTYLISSYSLTGQKMSKARTSVHLRKFVTEVLLLLV